jgi:hypothetical protein
MFKKAVGLSFLSLGLFIAVLILAMWGLSTPPSIQRNEMANTEQNKTGVIKEAYLVQADGSCLHEYLCAKSSVFKIIKTEGKTRFMENLEEVSAVLEEMISQNGQPIKQIRSFQAVDGIWDYSTQHLNAKKAVVSIVESHKAGLKPIFQGQAELLDMYLEQGKPKISIQGFKAKLQKEKT